MLLLEMLHQCVQHHLQPKLYSDEQIPAFKKLADTLHQYDCKVALQHFPS